MIEKSLYENYQIAFSDNLKPDFEDYLFVFNDNRELFLTPKKELPKTLDEFDIEFCLFIGKYNSKNCFVVNADFKNGYDLREVYEFNPDLYHIAGKAVLVRDWYISHRFCGRCGTKTQLDEKDMMLKCPSCGQVHYPRIAPAIIVAIRNLEEVGIKIKNLKYQRSQSWPFPNSLMLAFTAEYESGDIKVDGDEILKANWFKKDEIIRYNSDISISDWLIQDFIDKKY